MLPCKSGSALPPRTARDALAGAPSAQCCQVPATPLSAGASEGTPQWSSPKAGSILALVSFPAAIACLGLVMLIAVPGSKQGLPQSNLLPDQSLHSRPVHFAQTLSLQQPMQSACVPSRHVLLLFQKPHFLQESILTVYQCTFLPQGVSKKA